MSCEIDFQGLGLFLCHSAHTGGLVLASNLGVAYTLAPQGVYLSGQRGRAVNPLRYASVVRIHSCPPLSLHSTFSSWRRLSVWLGREFVVPARCNFLRLVKLR